MGAERNMSANLSMSVLEEEAEIKRNNKEKDKNNESLYETVYGDAVL